MDNLKPFDSIISAFEIGDFIINVRHNKKYIASVNGYGYPNFWVEKDDCFTLNENLQLFYELINEAVENNVYNSLFGEIN